MIEDIIRVVDSVFIHQDDDSFIPKIDLEIVQESENFSKKMTLEYYIHGNWNNRVQERKREQLVLSVPELKEGQNYEYSWGMESGGWDKEENITIPSFDVNSQYLVCVHQECLWYDDSYKIIMFCPNN